MKLRKTVGASLALTTLLLLPAAPALAATEPTIEAPDESSAQAMVITGYDEAVAEANGFEIVTHPDGTQESVPRTPEAEAIRAQFKTPAAARGEIFGDCGSAYVWATKNANDELQIDTGYDVIGPVIARSWTVFSFTLFTTFSMNFPNGSDAGVFDATGYTTMVGPGVSEVTGSSRVVLADGTDCNSLHPTDTFG